MDQTYEEKQQLIYQVQSTNYLPKSKVKIDLNASYTDGQMNILDYKAVTWFDGYGFRTTHSSTAMLRCRAGSGS
ncbi:MAG: hypothetical protein IPG74_11415 [Flavobacteriales bacterium]|nr:hypothetical protein [Flavobacteriales bacterium]